MDIYQKDFYQMVFYQFLNFFGHLPNGLLPKINTLVNVGHLPNLKDIYQKDFYQKDFYQTGIYQLFPSQEMGLLPKGLLPKQLLPKGYLQKKMYMSWPQSCGARCFGKKEGACFSEIFSVRLRE